ncbi:MAG: alpha/beta fold hydrolase, partial [Solirubrobacterales bacterium]
GPGDTGVGLIKGDPTGIDAFGDGRFDVVSWDPRGTHASSRVKCFRSGGAEARFWAGASIPTSNAASKKFVPKVKRWTRGCEKVSGWLRPHITTADTARDLNHLRVLSGESKLTYIGLSYGSMLGQTYANMYPGKVRAMLLEGIVDAQSYTRNAETRIASGIRDSDDVYMRFLSLCEKAGHARCPLAGGNLTARQRFEKLLNRLKSRQTPAPGTSPPLSSPESLSYSDFLISQFQPIRNPGVWPQNASAVRAAWKGNGSGLESGSREFTTPAGWAGVATSASIQCADGPARQGISAWPKVIDRFKGISRLQGAVQGWWGWAPCAASSTRSEDSYRGPWGKETKNPILLINQTHEPNTPYANAVNAEKYLGNAVLLTLNGYGHLPFQDPSACVTAAERAYLISLVVPSKGSVCQADRQPFDPGFGQPLSVVARASDTARPSR